MISENILRGIKTKAQKLLSNGHWQTIMPLYLTDILIKVEYTRERLDTPDGDFIDLDWVNRELDNAPTLILFHGMEGNSQSHYAKRILYYLKEIGWRGVVAHARGCSEELNRTLNFYHAGLTTDIDLVVKTLSARCNNRLFAAGVSLGGNALLKYLGEGGNNANLIEAAVVISAPFQLLDCSLNINRGINRYLYQPYFMRTLLVKMKQYATQFPELNLYPNVKTMDDFNNLYITQLYQFRDSVDYYNQSSSIKYLKNIVTPCMIIQAANDPLIPAKTWPHQSDLSNSITFVGLQQGGHVGFIGNNHNFKKAILKLPRIMVQYLNLFS